MTKKNRGAACDPSPRFGLSNTEKHNRVNQVLTLQIYENVFIGANILYSF